MLGNRPEILALAGIMLCDGETKRRTPESVLMDSPTVLCEQHFVWAQAQVGKLFPGVLDGT